QAVEAAGYEVRPESTTPQETAADIAAEVDAEAVERDRELRDVKLRALTSLGIAAVIMAVVAWPGGLFAMEDANKLVLLPATFVQFWAGGRFMRAARKAGRHGDGTREPPGAIGTHAG